jgi:hypothetical protein
LLACLSLFSSASFSFAIGCADLVFFSAIKYRYCKNNISSRKQNSEWGIGQKLKTNPFFIKRAGSRPRFQDPRSGPARALNGSRPSGPGRCRQAKKSSARLLLCGAFHSMACSAQLERREPKNCSAQSRTYYYHGRTRKAVRKKKGAGVAAAGLQGDGRRETGGEKDTSARPLRSASSLPSLAKPPCPFPHPQSHPTRAGAAEGQPHVHATGARTHLRGRRICGGALVFPGRDTGRVLVHTMILLRSWGWEQAGHPDHWWLAPSIARERAGGPFFFSGGWVTLLPFLGPCLTLPFALPLFLRALLASLCCCLPSRLL